MNAHRPACSFARTAVFAGLLALLGGVSSRAQLTDVLWNSAITAGDWSNTANWIPNNLVPGVPHRAVIGAGTPTVTVSSVTQVGAIAFSGGTITGTQALTLVDTGSTWTGGTMSGTGSTNIGSAANLTISGTGHTLNGRAIQNSGTVFQSNGAPVVLSGANTITNQGLWDLQTNAPFTNSGYTFNNTSAGVLNKSTEGGLLSFTPALTNNGLVYVSSGTLSLDGGGSSSSSFEIEAGAILQFNSNYTLGVGTDFIGGGAVQVAGGTVTLASGFTLRPGTFTLFGGTLTGDGTWEVPTGGTGFWFGGMLTGTGNTLIKGELQISTGGGNPVLSGRNLVNQGYIYFAPQDYLALAGNVQITNSTGAVFDLGADRTFQRDIGTHLFVNQSGATLMKTETSGTFTFNVPVQNAGNVLVTSGTLAFTSTFTHTGGSLVLNNGSNLQFSSGLNLSAGVLTGAGTVTGNVVSGALIAPGQSPGILNINGNLTLLATSTLLFELSGTNPGVTYDTLNVSGTASLNGSLLITFASGFQNTVTSGDTFVLIGAEAVTGTFTNPSGAPARVGTTDGFGSFQVNYTGVSVTLSNFVPIPEPSTWALMITGGLALALQLRRRLTR